MDGQQSLPYTLPKERKMMLKSLVGFFVSFSVADATRIVFDISSAGYFDGDFASTKANGRVVVSG